MLRTENEASSTTLTKSPKQHGSTGQEQIPGLRAVFFGRARVQERNMDCDALTWRIEGHAQMKVLLSFEQCVVCRREVDEMDEEGVVWMGSVRTIQGITQDLQRFTIPRAAANPNLQR